MESATTLVPVEAVRVELGVIHADRPVELVAVATEAADALAGVIKAKKLFSTISGREYVRVEGWTTLATMMGCLPRELQTTRETDGSYIAIVELVRMSDGAVLTRASASCGMDEPVWAKRADYARRSMAATRATSKACRLAFSWVMALAGYEVTPAEEIPERGGTSPAVKGPRVPAAVPLVASAPTTSETLIPWAGKVWPVGASKGKPLEELSSVDLVAGRQWIKKTGRYGELLEIIDELLASREG